MKTCSKCGEMKPLEAFHNHAARRDGKHPWCKACHCAAVRAHNAASPQKQTERQRAWRSRPENARKNAEYRRAYLSRDGKREAHNAAGKAARKREIASISDGYVLSLLAEQCGVSTSEVPTSLVAPKRQQIALKRLSRQIKSHIKEQA